MNINAIKREISNGETTLGIELGSTRIKGVLITSDHKPIASGGFGWENQYDNGVWTYSLDTVWNGIQACYADLSKDVREKYGVELQKLKTIGVSAMMHGYLAFDQNGEQLVPFRTWRNTITEQAAKELTTLFDFNIPQRWSIAHLYQAILNQEEHIEKIDFITTLAGYVHWKLTGKRVLGIGDGSGVFPIDSSTKQFDAQMISRFNELPAVKALPWKLTEILPQVLSAGEEAGRLTPEGASLLDSTGKLEAGTPCCPPEGDAGTGMAATNSVAVRTGNVSAGTSVFAMVVLEKPLSKVYTEIDMVTTPTGKPVAMVHCNNCTSDIDAWAGLFQEAAEALGAQVDPGKLYTTLYSSALKGESDCGKIISYNYLAGETITGLDEGRPLVVRMPDSNFTLSNFMRSLLFSALATLKLGMNILSKEQVQIDKLLGHGGFFKTKEAGQKLAAAALETPVAVMETAGEGGAWGIALLAAYLSHKSENETLEQYLGEKVFAANAGSTIAPDPKDVESFKQFSIHYSKALEIERTAVTCLPQE